MHANPPYPIIESLCSHLNPAFALEVIPNRDSMPYADKYGIAGPALRSMSRGTLRYSGFCASMAALTALGFLSTTPEALPQPPTLRGWFAAAVALPPKSSDDALLSAASALVAAAARRSIKSYTEPLPPSLSEKAHAAAINSTNMNLDSDHLREAAFRRLVAWCGFLSDAPLNCSQANHTPIDSLVTILTSMPEMSFAAGERDMVIMQHVIEVRMGWTLGYRYMYGC